jgi:hypothetical protein
MRRLMIIPLVGALVLAAAAPVAAGPNTSNTSGSGRTIQAEWYADSSHGSVYLFEESNGTYGELFDESGDYVQCDPSDEYDYRFQGTRIFGWGQDLTVDLDTKLRTGSASGDFEIVIETVDECAWSSEATFDVVHVVVDLVGTGPSATFRSSGSFKIPGDYNSHDRYRGTERAATGTVDLGSLGSRDVDWAMMASYSWSEHSNG